jgi:hypothetical protein
MKGKWILALAAVGCSAPEPAPAPEPPPAWVLEADRDLVGPGGAARVEIEIDWFSQVPPDVAALDGLLEVARRECRGKDIEIRRDSELPAERWKSCKGDRIEQALDECRGRTAAEPGVAYVHVLYAPFNPWGEAFGSNGLCRRLQKPFPHWQIFVFKGTLQKRAILSLSASALDRSCLVHEFGHALGLVANPEHRFEDGGGHCTDTGCVMTKPKLKAILANAVKTAVTGETPWDYCSKCRSDLERGREAYSR